MDRIFCTYHDEETEQDLGCQEPDLDEAIAAFRSFCWENVKPASSMKLLIFQTYGKEEASIWISAPLETRRWDVMASANVRRRFLGPFFKRKTRRLFADSGAAEVENLINILFTYSLAEYVAFLDGNEAPTAALRLPTPTMQPQQQRPAQPGGPR